MTASEISVSGTQTASALVLCHCICHCIWLTTDVVHKFMLQLDSKTTDIMFANQMHALQSLAISSMTSGLPCN